MTSVTGTMFEKGEGVPQDFSEAMKWYQKAADKGNPTAQKYIGLILNFCDFIAPNVPL
jgi:TPR repeat protein